MTVVPPAPISGAGSVLTQSVNDCPGKRLFAIIAPSQFVYV